jgi:hypothetical protein
MKDLASYRRVAVLFFLFLKSAGGCPFVRFSWDQRGKALFLYLRMWMAGFSSSSFEWKETK